MLGGSFGATSNGFRADLMRYFLLTVLGFLLTAGFVASHEHPTGIKGRVTSEAAAVFVGVDVKILNRETRQVISIRTNESGEYSLDLTPGVYDVSVAAASFKSQKRKGIEVSQNVRSIVDFVLKFGKPEVVA